MARYPHSAGTAGRAGLDGKRQRGHRGALNAPYVKCLTDKDVEKYSKRYETYVRSKTTDSLVDSFILLASRAAGMAVNIKDIDADQKEPKNDYIINKEVSGLAGSLALRCGRLLAVANAALITTRHMTFANPEGTAVEIPGAQQIPEHSAPIPEHSPETC